MSARAHWSGRLAFILAATGSAIGLGNIWKFPYMAGENGGGAFVLVYLLFIAAVGIPIFISELFVGQKSQSNAVTAFEVMDKKNSPWQAIGWMGVLAAVLILSFYSVVGGWILDFEYNAILGTFNQMTEEQIQGQLGGLFADPVRMIMWHTIFMVLVMLIVYSGVKDGLERWNKILMPALFLILVILLFQAISLDGFGRAVSFLFSPDFSKLTPAGALEAVGHAFFTLSLGMGTILTYGSYLSEKESLPRVALMVGFLDTLIALVAGIVIFSIVFTFGLNPGGGPGLIFATLPALFVKMDGGQFLSIIFFLLVTFAAITSAVSILEVPVAYISEKFGVGRHKTSTLVALVIYLFGILCALSFNTLSDVKVFGYNFFDLFDKISANILLPVGGMGIAVFFGWKLGNKAVDTVLEGAPAPAKFLFLWSCRVIAPAGVIAILINTAVG